MDHEPQSTAAENNISSPEGRNSTASEGNFLEAANLVCSAFERAFVGRSTKHTGQNVVVVTPGTGVYHVDYDLAQLTKHRFVDSGCGCDLVCLSHKPLHAVALLVFKGHEGFDRFSIAGWVHVSYFQPQPPSPERQFQPTCQMPSKHWRQGGHQGIATRDQFGMPSRVVRLQTIDSRISQFGHRDRYQAHDNQVFSNHSPPMHAKQLRVSPSEGNLQALLFRVQEAAAKELHVSPSVGDLTALHDQLRDDQSIKRKSVDGLRPEPQLSQTPPASTFIQQAGATMMNAEDRQQHPEQPKLAKQALTASRTESIKSGKGTRIEYLHTPTHQDRNVNSTMSSSHGNSRPLDAQPSNSTADLLTTSFDTVTSRYQMDHIVDHAQTHCLQVPCLFKCLTTAAKMATLYQSLPARENCCKQQARKLQDAQCSADSKRQLKMVSSCTRQCRPP